MMRQPGIMMYWKYCSVTHRSQCRIHASPNWDLIGIHNGSVPVRCQSNYSNQWWFLINYTQRNRLQKNVQSTNFHLGNSTQCHLLLPVFHWQPLMYYCTAQPTRGQFAHICNPRSERLHKYLISWWSYLIMIYKYCIGALRKMFLMGALKLHFLKSL